MSLCHAQGLVVGTGMYGDPITALGLFSFFSKNFILFLLEYSWFKVLCQFLLYSIVTQSYICVCVCMYIYTHFFSHTIFHHVLPQGIRYRPLCCSVGPHCISILNVIEGCFLIGFGAFLMKLDCCIGFPPPLFLGLHSQHMEVPRLGVELELQLAAYTTAIATQDLSGVCYLHRNSRQHWSLNPVSKARDWTRNLMVTSQIRFCCTTTGTLYRISYIRDNLQIVVVGEQKAGHFYPEHSSWQMNQEVFTLQTFSVWGKLGAATLERLGGPSSPLESILQILLKIWIQTES